MNHRPQIRTTRIAPPALLVAVLLLGGGARAALVGGSATVSTLVQEMIDGAPASTTLDNGVAGLLSAALPVSATGELTSTDLAGELVSQGRALARLSDPTRLNQTNPEGFRLEAACYSNADNVGYVVSAVATQQRDIVFATGGDATGDVEVTFDNDGTASIASSVFVSGAVLVWSTRSADALTGIEGDIQITVTRNGETVPLFSTGLTVSADDTGGLTVESAGPLTITTLTLEDLSATGLLNDETLANLTGLNETGLLTVIAIEAQSHDYTYGVSADVPLTLTAEMTINLRTPPGGIGIAATLGGPFEELAAFVDDGLPDTSGAGVQRAINAGAGLDANGATGDSAAVLPAPSLFSCGAFGLEAMMMLLATLTAPICRRRHRPIPSRGRCSTNRS